MSNSKTRVIRFPRVSKNNLFGIRINWNIFPSEKIFSENMKNEEKEGLRHNGFYMLSLSSIAQSLLTV